MIALLLLTLLQPAVSGLRPDLSPGEAKPMTREQICQQAYSPDASTSVPSTLWAAVLQRYGLSWEQRMEYLAATIIPTALGGLMSLRNVFPIPKVSEWSLSRKQLVEQKVFSELCLGHLTVGEAQSKAGVQWETTWRIYFAR